MVVAVGAVDPLNVSGCVLVMNGLRRVLQGYGRENMTGGATDLIIKRIKFFFLTSGKQSCLQAWHFSVGYLFTFSTKNAMAGWREGLCWNGGSLGLGLRGLWTHRRAISLACSVNQARKTRGKFVS